MYIKAEHSFVKAKVCQVGIFKDPPTSYPWHSMRKSATNRNMYYISETTLTAKLGGTPQV